MNTMRWITCGVTVLALGIGYGCQSSTVGDESAEVIGVESQAQTTTMCRQAVATACQGQTRNHGACVSCVAQAVHNLSACSGLSGAQRADIVNDYAHRDLTCAPVCTPPTCTAEQECGTIPNPCDPAHPISCGPACPMGKTCEHNRCVPVCTPPTCTAEQECGTIPNPCDPAHPISCGPACPMGKTCEHNRCVPVCPPACTPPTCTAEQECGTIPNPCDPAHPISCGPACPMGKTCEHNKCVRVCD